MRFPLLRKLTLVTPGVLLCAGGIARGQSGTVEDPALEFRADLPGARISLDGPATITGASPLRIPGPISGNFWLTASGPGTERQLGRVSIRLEESGSRIVSFGGVGLRPRLMRALTFPGLAPIRMRQEKKGLLMGAATATGIAFSVWAHSELRDARLQLEAAEKAYQDGVGSPEAAGLRLAMLEARAEESFRRTRRDILLGVVGAAWGVGLLDAAFFAPRFQVKNADGGSLTLRLYRRRRGQAVLRSLVFPGLGQSYCGHGRKAAGLALGALLAGSYYVYEQNDYNDALHDLSKARRRARMAVPPGEEAALQAREEALAAIADDNLTDRNIALGILVGWWTLSALDAALSFEEPWGGVGVPGPRRLGWHLDPARGSLAAQLRF